VLTSLSTIDKNGIPSFRCRIMVPTNIITKVDFLKIEKDLIIFEIWYEIAVKLIEQYMKYSLNLLVQELKKRNYGKNCFRCSSNRTLIFFNCRVACFSCILWCSNSRNSIDIHWNRHDIFTVDHGWNLWDWRTIQLALESQN